METNKMVKTLRRLQVQTASLACLGCGHEHNCSTRGCAIIREAADQLEQGTHKKRIAIDRQALIDLIIDAKRTDPETGSFTEWLADYLIEHLPIAQPNEWISVGDRLPGQWNNVIAFYNSGVIRQSWVNGNNEWLFADIYGAVTHWMPLPNPPADQKTGDEQ